MILGIKKRFVINEFRSKRLRHKRNLNTCNPMGSDPFQRNTSLYFYLMASTFDIGGGLMSKKIGLIFS